MAARKFDEREAGAAGPEKLCRMCGQAIAAARLEALPETELCVACARKNPPAPIDVRKLDISEASPISRNGFAPGD